MDIRHGRKRSWRCELSLSWATVWEGVDYDRESRGSRRRGLLCRVGAGGRCRLSGRRRGFLCRVGPEGVFFGRLGRRRGLLCRGRRFGRMWITTENAGGGGRRGLLCRGRRFGRVWITTENAGGGGRRGFLCRGPRFGRVWITTENAGGGGRRGLLCHVGAEGGREGRRCRPLPQVAPRRPGRRTVTTETSALVSTPGHPDSAAPTGRH